jgi:hypothetical protein
MVTGPSPDLLDAQNFHKTNPEYRLYTDKFGNTVEIPFELFGS